MKTSSKILIIVATCTLIVLASFFSVFFISFKLDYKQQVLESSAKNDINASLVFAIIKAESKFDKNAKSRAGAIGLMQIKLESANYCMQMDGMDSLTESQLFDISTNIAVGARYLKYLLSKFEVTDTAICAYNAGETTVRQWLNNKNYSSDGKTLFKIPYAETRQYLNKVKFNETVYQKLLK